MKGFLLAAAAACLLAAAPSFAAPVEVGQPVPEFTLPNLEGKSVSFEKDIRGKSKLTLFFFMTTACSPCFEELKEIDAFMAKNGGKVDAYAIAVDLRGASTVAAYQQANNFKVKYLIDPKFTLPRAFGFNYTPSLAIIGPNGDVLHKKGGYSPNEKITDLIRTFLK